MSDEEEPTNDNDENRADLMPAKTREEEAADVAEMIGKRIVLEGDVNTRAADCDCCFCKYIKESGKVP